MELDENDVTTTTLSRGAKKFNDDKCCKCSSADADENATEENTTMKGRGGRGRNFPENSDNSIENEIDTTTATETATKMSTTTSAATLAATSDVSF